MAGVQAGEERGAMNHPAAHASQHQVEVPRCHRNQLTVRRGAAVELERSTLPRQFVGGAFEPQPDAGASSPGQVECAAAYRALRANSESGTHTWRTTTGCRTRTACAASRR